MKINLEKACIGFLIGILLFCVCNKIFLVEGVEAHRCAQGKKQKCPDGTLCDDIRNCEDSDACICPSGGGSDSPPPTDGKIPLKPISNPSQFLSDINKHFENTSSNGENTSSNGVMVSMNVLNNKGNVNVDGSTTILRMDSSWNIWFTPCYDRKPHAHSSGPRCCIEDDRSPQLGLPYQNCDMSIGFGWIWDPNNLPHIDCVYDTDATTVHRLDPDSKVLDRCGGSISRSSLEPTMCNDDDNSCIESMLQSARERLKCPNDDVKCDQENEVVISRYTDRGGKNINSINIQNKPSALLFVYDPTIFGFKEDKNLNGLMLRDTLQKRDGGREKTYDTLLNTLDENTYVVIMESLKLKTEYGNPQPERMIPRFTDIVKLTELETYFESFPPL